MKPTQENPARGILWAYFIELVCVTLFAIGLSAMAGCAGKEMTQEQWAIQQQRAAQALMLAKESGAIAVLQLGHDGRAGLYASEEFGLNTGANFNATLLFVPGLTGMVDKLHAAMKPLPTNP